MRRFFKLISAILTINLLLINYFPFTGNNVKPVSAQEETISTGFLYTAGGQRIAKLEDGGNHTYYLPGVEIVIDENGGISYRKYYAFNGAVAVRDNNGISYTHSEQLGSTAVTTDSNGALIGSASYYPFGTTKTSEGTVVGERLYTGQVSDEDITGLYYYNARYYSPSLGRFTQADTASSGQNRYAYVGNDPINFSDPSGHKDKSACNPEDFSCRHDGDISFTPSSQPLRMCEDTSTAPAVSQEDINAYYSSGAYFYEMQDQVGAIVIPIVLVGGSYLLGPEVAEAVDTTVCIAMGGKGECVNPFPFTSVANSLPNAGYIDNLAPVMIDDDVLAAGRVFLGADEGSSATMHIIPGYDHQILKLFNGPYDENTLAYYFQEIENARIVGDLGEIGPEFGFVFTTPSGHFGYAMEYFAGGFPERVPQYITSDTFNSLSNVMRKLNNAGYVQPDFQFFVLPNGTVKLIDMGSISPSSMVPWHLEDVSYNLDRYHNYFSSIGH